MDVIEILKKLQPTVEDKQKEIKQKVRDRYNKKVGEIQSSEEYKQVLKDWDLLDKEIQELYNLQNSLNTKMNELFSKGVGLRNGHTSRYDYEQEHVPKALKAIDEIKLTAMKEKTAEAINKAIEDLKKL